MAIALLFAVSFGVGCRGGRDCGVCTNGSVPFVNVDDCHCCLPYNASCTSDSQCCAGCVNGKCGCLPGPGDAGVYERCGNAAACCSGQCEGGFCK